MSMDLLLLAAVFVPFLGMGAIVLLGHRPNLREGATFVTAGTLFAIVLSIAPAVSAGARPSLVFAEPVPGLPLMLVAEPLGILFALIASGLWIVTSLYSIGYMRGNDEKHQTRFYACFAIALGATMGVAFAGNMITLFVFYEVLTLSTYPLVAHKGNEEARAGARVYLGLLLATSIGFLLFGMIGTWIVAGTLDFRDGGILAGQADPLVTAVLLVLYMFGIGKAALMPFHRWLPSAMVAPTPVSALLHAVAVVKAGVFTVVKVILYIFGVEHLANEIPSGWLVYAAGFTILAASIIALRQDNLKKRLAYSTVSQLSYVVLAAAILAPLSVMAAALHIAAHAFGKITLFFAAGSIYTAAHKTEISQLDGIGRRMPWTMTAFAIGALSMIGVPPAAGFISKWYLLVGAMDARHLVAVCVVIASTLLNAAYFLPIVHRAFFRAPADEGQPHGEAPLPIVIALTITAVLTVAMFLYPEPAIRLASQLPVGAQ
jgi:multicomponent Na+:H+ antiporter subunit D